MIRSFASQSQKQLLGFASTQFIPKDFSKKGKKSRLDKSSVSSKSYSNGSPSQDSFPGFSPPEKLQHEDKNPISVAQSGGPLQRLIDTPRYLVVGVSIAAIMSGYLFWSQIFDDFLYQQKRTEKKLKYAKKQTPVHP